MDILNFSKWLDTKILKAWLEVRGMDPKLADDLPEIGFIAQIGQAQIAAGFLRQVEGGSGQIDSLITHPLAEPELRHQAIDLIVERLLEAARIEGMDQVTAYSTDAHTLVRAKKHGFKLLPHTVMALDLRGK